jgi:plasmid stabilization system protein ParE
VVYKIIYLKEARADVIEAKIWYKSQLVGLEKRFAKDVKIALEKLKTFPTSHSIRFQNLRIANLKVFPYCIYYFVDDDVVAIVAIIHSKRNSRLLKNII